MWCYRTIPSSKATMPPLAKIPRSQMVSSCNFHFESPRAVHWSLHRLVKWFRRSFLLIVPNWDRKVYPSFEDRHQPTGYLEEKAKSRTEDARWRTSFHLTPLKKMIIHPATPQTGWGTVGAWQCFRKFFQWVSVQIHNQEGDHYHAICLARVNILQLPEVILGYSSFQSGCNQTKCDIWNHIVYLEISSHMQTKLQGIEINIASKRVWVDS